MSFCKGTFTEREEIYMSYQVGHSKRNRFTALGRRAALTLATLFLMLPLVTSPSFAEENAKVKEAMQSLKQETAALGQAKLEGENLFFGTTKINGDFTVVDAVKTKHEGTATLFAKKDANFVRISTNVMKEGKRAIGTILDPSGPAYAAINKGEAYYGLVDILGKIYDTGYEPIKTASGEVVGIYYVGYLME
jgi:hypothetical protein